MARNRNDLVFTIKVLLSAAAALVVLASWLIHPTMSGEMIEPGKWLVGVLMIGVVIVALVALIFGANSNSTSDRS